MKKYFIDISFYVPKNKLEEMLQVEFKKIEHHTITEDKIRENFNIRFINTYTDHRNNKGRSKATMDVNPIDNNIIYSFGKSLIITLILVEGEL